MKFRPGFAEKALASAVPEPVRSRPSPALVFLFVFLVGIILTSYLGEKYDEYVQIPPLLLPVRNGMNWDGVPEYLNISGQSWLMLPVLKEQMLIAGDDGETSCLYRQIRYVTNTTKPLLRQVLLHEIFHAGACTHGGDSYWNSINPTGSKHPGVYHLGDFTSDFFYANPDFTKWLIEN